ncbi:hypothetical protein [Paenarthrobacter ureafaciens]|uniref:hypothetical protein n=1 Tax=Paenarthrobacter ureafaciens TaxID=37931 RepID=UPI003CE8F8CB
MPRHFTGSPDQRAEQWAAYLAESRAHQTLKNLHICRQDLGPSHYANVLLTLHRSKNILKTVLRTQVERTWPDATPTAEMPLAAWDELQKAIKPKPRRA